MARPARPWFRFYVEACHDPKLRRLKPGERWLWVAVLAIARQSCLPGLLLISEREHYQPGDIADFAAMPERDVSAALAKFEAVGMLARNADIGCWEVANWSERQFETDDVTSRVQRFRERRSNVSTPLPETPPDTETENRDRDPDLLSGFGVTQEAGPQAVDKREKEGDCCCVNGWTEVDGVATRCNHVTLRVVS